MPAVNCAHSTREARPLSSGLTQKPGAGLCRSHSSPEDDSRPGQGFCAAARMGQRGRAVSRGAWPTGTNHGHFCKTALALRGAWILLKANSPVSRSLGKACCRAPVNAPPPPGSAKAAQRFLILPLRVRLGRLT